MKGVIYIKEPENLNSKAIKLELSLKTITKDYILLIGTFQDNWSAQLKDKEIDAKKCYGIGHESLIQFGANIKGEIKFSPDEIFMLLARYYKSHGNMDIMEEIQTIKQRRYGIDGFFFFKYYVNKYLEQIEKKKREKNGINE